MGKQATKWKVKGLDRNTGEARSILVDAANEWTARERAADAGIVVESVTPLRPMPASAAGSGPAPAHPPYAAQKPAREMSEGERTFWSIFKKIALGYGIFVGFLILSATAFFLIVIVIMVVAFISFAKAM